MGSYNINKIGLSCFDAKRYVLDNGIDTLAYGHYMIKKVDWVVLSIMIIYSIIVSLLFSCIEYNDDILFLFCWGVIKSLLHKMIQAVWLEVIQ
jgi:hypothetical protein